MPNEHTIAENLQRLIDAKDDIAAAITAKGGTVAQGDGLEEFPADIASIQGGLEMNVKFTADKNGIPAYMFYNNHGSESENKAYPIKEVVIGDGIRAIATYAFAFCTSLTSITIPDSVTSISIRAFQGCTSLTSITIPDSVANIGGSAFRECTSLTNITIGNGVNSINSNTFTDCPNLTTITLNKPQDSVSGAPWGATNATVVWTG